MKFREIIKVCVLICFFALSVSIPSQAAETLVISNKSDSITTTKKADSIFSSAKTVGKLIAKYKFKYGKSKYSNLKNSIKKKRSFCADYVTWALQENGDLSTKYRIYGTRSGKLAGSGRKAVLKYYKKIKVNKVVRKVKFKPGDIVCVNKISGKFGWHMMIFAKYNKRGQPMWYSGGSDATIRKNCYYSRKKLTTPRRLSYYEKANTAFILRRKANVND